MIRKNHKPAYPFLCRRCLPSVQSFLWADRAIEDPGWFTTAMVPQARNHCAAVMAANLGLYSSLFSGEAPDPSLLLHIYEYIGNGPVVRGASQAAAALRKEGFLLRPSPCITRRCIRAAIKRGMPCALLLCASPTDWHWVLCTGMLTADMHEYFAVADGWSRETHFLRCGPGSHLIFAARFASENSRRLKAPT